MDIAFLIVFIILAIIGAGEAFSMYFQNSEIDFVSFMLGLFITAIVLSIALIIYAKTRKK